ncbi:MAG: bifunctional phosphopantothenoylcysteine decarboxylase/phosphopantothenate--cysteine ligase CoaBC [Peptoniphilaceae bacterium]|nr:bifunctional phosphopantothenoylcysteine decarboxylase/phosphopantothenate--cysteine ligase CoaBC [Peptoniphilaceae bacterium]
MSEELNVLAGKNILIGVTGGIACYKILELCSRLKKKNANLKIIETAAAKEFIKPAAFETMGKCKVYSDLFEGTNDQVHHIELARWADIFLIAPASANTIAKMANGIADNFLTSTYLAYDKDLILAPAMNTVMFHNKATVKNLQTLADYGAMIIQPETGMLACNTIGDGRMEEPENIVMYLEEYFASKDSNLDLAGKKIIVSAGPTIEPIDYVRYITNRSSGKMGYNIANEARRRGAEVILVSGPVNPMDTPDITKIDVKTNEDMQNAIDEHFASSDVLIMAAAPVDYKVANPSDKKIKKNGSNLDLNLVENVDIIKYFADKKDEQTIIGFAAETDDLIDNAKTKLEFKGLDYIIANNLKDEGAGFDVDTNLASIISKDQVKKLDLMKKTELANVILDLIR